LAANAALLAAMLALVAADTACTDLIDAAALIAADQVVLATCAAGADSPGRAAFLRTCASYGAASQAADTAIFFSTAMPVTCAPDWATRPIKAEVGVSAAGASTEWGGAGTRAEDADPIAGAAATGAAAAIRTTGASTAVWHAAGGGRRLLVPGLPGLFLFLLFPFLFLALAFGSGILLADQPESQSADDPEHCGEARCIPTREQCAQRPSQPVELRVIHRKAFWASPLLIRMKSR